MARFFSFFLVLNALLIILPKAISEGPIPQDPGAVQGWVDANIKPLADRKGTLDPALEAAEAEPPKVIKVIKEGGGDFTTITEAVKSIPESNKQRIIISIGPGEYFEKVKIEKRKNFITFLGDATNMPTMIFNGTAAEYTVVESGTLTVDGDYFVAANLIIKNSSPRPDGIRKLAQAAAMRIGGNYATFYNVKFYGFQDTLCDDAGKHFYKDCYIEGTVDFIFGNGQTLYLNCEIACVPGEREAWITAHARVQADGPSGYVFVHCPVKGEGQVSFLGRAWTIHSRVIWAYSELSEGVNPKAWSPSKQPEPEKNLFFAEIGNTGPGADMSQRAPFTKKLTEEEAKPFLGLEFIEGCKWVLPPPCLK